MAEHILFLTGKLAAKSLARVLDSLEAPGFTWDIHNIGVSVAALMTSGMIVRRLKDLKGADRVTRNIYAARCIEESRNFSKR